MKTVLEKILTMHRLTAEGVAENTGNNAVFNDGDITVASEQEVGQTVKIVKNSRKQKLSATQKKRASEKTAWERVLTSREKDRPVGEDYISGLFEEFIEFHGDRNHLRRYCLFSGTAGNRYRADERKKYLRKY